MSEDEQPDEDEQERDDDLVEIRGDEENPGLKDVWIAGQPAGRLLDKHEKALGRVDKLEAKLEEAMAMIEEVQLDLSTARTPDGGDEMTKQDLTKHLTMRECIRVAEKGGNGSCDVATVRNMADRDGVDLHPETVRKAWSELEDEWHGFDVHDGQPGPHTPSKKIVLKGEAVTESMRQAADLATSNGEDA